MYDDDWLSVTDAAKLVGYHPVYLRDLIRAGEIEAKKVVTVWLVSKQSLLEYVQNSQKQGAKRGRRTGA